MTRRRPWILVVGLPALLVFGALELYDQRPVLAEEAAPAASNAALDSSAAPFAVVELFTSEGCSSCPSAEALLNEVSREARKQSKRVFCLAWHVDYWDHLGWKDPYAKREHSVRQRVYGRALNSTRLYTPQMIVNGEDAFVGSRRRSARSAIGKALSATPALGVRLSLSAPGRAAYTLSGEVPPGARVLLCWAERGLESRIERGENSGKTLAHDGVVRASWGAKAAAKGELKFEAPRGAKRERSSLVLLVQPGRAGKVLGAARLDL